MAILGFLFGFITLIFLTFAYAFVVLMSGEKPYETELIIDIDIDHLSIFAVVCGFLIVFGWYLLFYHAPFTITMK